MKIFDSEMENSKTTIFEGNASQDFNAFMKKHSYGKTVFLIDENVLRFHGDRIKEEFKGFSSERLVVIPSGEASKSMEILEHIYNCLSEMEINRDDLLVAIGGGVVGDIAGFAAGTFKRGMDYVNVPTTLLAQVDSSAGGKTAVNLETGKNLVGMFHHPRAVFADRAFLNTLKKKVLLDGMAELVKYGCIGDRGFLEYISEAKPEDFLEKNASYCVQKALATKMKYVAEDERDRGRRMLLNFGHTIAHVSETVEGYESVSHGRAVARGMLQITRLSENKGLTEKGTSKSIEEALAALGFEKRKLGETLIDKASLAIMKRDKKTMEGCLNLVLLKRIGEAFIHKVPLEELEDFFTAGKRGKR
ncbi:MAG: 3-dehydroquinate synthase [Peptostreptococcaceae bacterium]|nr:3-dehydroquinate synthase [Peptostreptococcaceae bacterium]